MDAPGKAVPGDPLYELGSAIGMAEASLRKAAALSPGDPALQAGLLTRAAWCRKEFDMVADRMARRLSRRLEDNARRD